MDNSHWLLTSCWHYCWHLVDITVDALEFGFTVIYGQLSPAVDAWLTLLLTRLEFGFAIGDVDDCHRLVTPGWRRRRRGQRLSQQSVASRAPLAAGAAAAVRQRRHAADEQVAYRVAEVDVERAVEEEVDGEVDRLQRVRDDERDVVGRVSGGGDDVEQAEQFGRPDEDEEEEDDGDERRREAVADVGGRRRRRRPALERGGAAQRRDQPHVAVGEQDDRRDDADDDAHARVGVDEGGRKEDTMHEADVAELVARAVARGEACAVLPEEREVEGDGAGDGGRDGDARRGRVDEAARVERPAHGEVAAGRHDDRQPRAGEDEGVEDALLVEAVPAGPRRRRRPVRHLGADPRARQEDGAQRQVGRR